jgi:hypothetical protein
VKTCNSKCDLGCKGLGSSALTVPTQRGFIMNKSKSIMLAAATAVASLLGAAVVPATASTYNLSNGNTSVTLDPSTMTNWTVDGTNQLGQQSFWYRVGASGVQQTVDSIGTPTVTQMSTNGGSDNWMNASYTDVAQAFQLSVTTMVSGGQSGSGVSDVSETVKVVNMSKTNSLSYHLFDYANFNLGGKTGNASANLTGNNTATVTAGGDMSQTVVSGKSNEYEAGTFSTLLTGLGSTSGLTLSGPTSVSNVDAEWAFEWDVTLAPGQSFLVTSDEQVQTVPEPTTSMALLGMGGLFFSRPRRRDEDPDPRTAQVAEA